MGDIRVLATSESDTEAPLTHSNDGSGNLMKTIKSLGSMTNYILLVIRFAADRNWSQS
jgi:hypothetical protein